ncbi:hypothetical protein L345_17786, partial [Ophiophagus hannah]
MFNSIYPIHKRPLIIRTGTDYKYTKIAVDRVSATDGRYHVLFLGTAGSQQSLCAYQVGDDDLGQGLSIPALEGLERQIGREGKKGREGERKGK